MFTKKMVKEILKKNKNKNKKVFQCEECKFLYKNKETAEKCQDWCSKHKSCNLKIIKYAVK